MACGCPVVASRIPSTEEVAGETPFYFTPGSAGDLTAALERAAAEGHGTARIQVGLDWVKRYNWDRTAAGTLAVYRELIGRKGI